MGPMTDLPAPGSTPHPPATHPRAARPRPAQAWSRIAREVIGTAYPWVPGHVITGPDDTRLVPEVLHPAFHGSFDWHSCVHMQWSLVTLLARYADALGPQESAAVRELLEGRLTREQVAVEVDYLRARPSFERPYGWAWAAQLVAATRELGEHDGQARRWAQALAPLAEVVADLALAWWPRHAYPVRHGKHQNDAFALLLLRDAYARLGRSDVVEAAEARARLWFGADGPAPTGHEPGGSDFLSPSLTEAMLMTQVLGGQDGQAWLERVLPGLGHGDGDGDHLLQAPQVLDPTDGQGAHLLGLALSRAWALRALAPWMTGPGHGPTAADRLRAAADEQEGAVLEQIIDGHFMATHWLVSFALLADGALNPRGADAV